MTLRLRQVVALFFTSVFLLGQALPATSDQCPSHLTSSTSPPIKVTVDWAKSIAVSRTSPSLMIEAHPLLRRGSPIHETVFQNVRHLGARYVRYHGQYLWPQLVVPELEPPTEKTTSWDFSKVDSIVIPFLEATKGHEPIVNFNTIPAWMFKTGTPTHYPDNPDQYTTGYAEGTELVDPSGHQLAEYYARVASWYTQGGFTDELGHYHHSGYHYELPWWEVLNEVEAEHQTSPQQYVIRYDAIVAAVHRVSPRTKFIGLGLAAMGRWSGTTGPAQEPAFFQYFLDPHNHKPGTPLDMISYHFYATPSATQAPDSWQYSVFDQADGFLNTVALIDSIRERLSPATRVALDELGIILPEYSKPRATLSPTDSIPEGYWNLSGSLFAYLFVELARQRIDVVTASQLLGDPKEGSGVDDPMGIDPDDSIPLIDWKSGQPNARFRVIQLLNENFAPGDELVETQFDVLFGVPPDVEIQGFVTPKGKKLLLINKRSTPIVIATTMTDRVFEIRVVDEETGGEAPKQYKPVDRSSVRMEPFAVAVATIE